MSETIGNQSTLFDLAFPYLLYYKVLPQDKRMLI